MRWPEAKILEAILHPEKLVRQSALRYFAHGLSTNPTVMPQAMRAIETFGQKCAFFHTHFLESLAQSEASIDWTLRELSQTTSVELGDYASHLCRLLCHADTDLLRPRRQEIRRTARFTPCYYRVFEERLEFAEWDADRCWQELHAMCETAAQSHDDDPMDWQRGDRLAEALSRHGLSVGGRVLELLATDPLEDEKNPLAWMETMLVQLSGFLRLEEAIPLLVAKLRLDSDMLSEECLRAFTRIGTDGVVEAVTQNWQDESWPFRLYASGGFNTLRCQALVSHCQALLPTEEDLSIKTNLALALLDCFATEGIEPVRQLILNRQFDPQMTDLPRELVTAAILMGETFPELQTWKGESQLRYEEVQQRIKRMYATLNAPRDTAPPPRAPGAFTRSAERVGRNDPCPCGSGKKYKKCCRNLSRV